MLFRKCNDKCATKFILFFLLWQIKYKEKFDNEMKDKKHHYNPLESVSFKQSQLATELASNVSVPWLIIHRKLFSIYCDSWFLRIGCVVMKQKHVISNQL